MGLKELELGVNVTKSEDEDIANNEKKALIEIDLSLFKQADVNNIKNDRSNNFRNFIVVIY